VHTAYNSNLHTVHTAYNSNLHTLHTTYNSKLHTMLTAYDQAADNHSQHTQCRTPHAVIYGLDLLTMGIMLPETC